MRFYSDSSTAHVRFYRSTESTPPRALARQCRFTMLYAVAPRSPELQDGSGTAAKEGGGVALGGRGTFRRFGQENVIFTLRWNRLGITETV